GGPANDSVADGEVDSAGNIYLIGSTSSDLFETNQGNRDIFVASYDAGGILRWGIQFGDAGDDRGLGIAIGNGGLYIVGDTNNGNFGLALPDDDSLGGLDAFVARLNPVDGATEWMRRFGTTQTDSARGVAVDSSGGVFVAGMTSGTLAGTGAQGDEDAFLARFSDAESSDGSPGSRKWVNQFGLDATAEDAAAVAVTDDFVYIAGKTGVVDSQGDAYVSRHSLSDGNRSTQWRIGNEGVDYANSLAIDSGGDLYIAGRTETDIDNDGINVQGPSDAFLAKIDPSTVEGVQWVQVLASSAEDEAFGVAVDDFGNLYVTGEANADLVGEINNYQGGGDVFTGRFTTDGDRNWLKFLGTSADETGFKVFLGGRGTVFVTGATNGDLDNVENAGGSDGFLVRYTSAGVLE
ncbi:MAG: SBBP repeat-containing protein, partial [Desulfuromonadales bacterium]